MLTNDKTRIVTVKGISEEEEHDILLFLQGSVYCWCKNRPEEWFSMRELMGGENYFWKGTPLQALYDKQKGTIKQRIEAAGKESGKLLKSLLKNDKQRKFRVRKGFKIKEYQWIKPKPE